MKNTLLTYTRLQVSHYPREDRYMLTVVQRNRFYDWVLAVSHRPFQKSDYGDNIWGDIWDWALHKSEDAAVPGARFQITKEEAQQISPLIGGKLDLTWPPTQSSDDH